MSLSFNVKQGQRIDVWLRETKPANQPLFSVRIRNEVAFKITTAHATTTILAGPRGMTVSPVWTGWRSIATSHCATPGTRIRCPNTASVLSPPKAMHFGY